MQGLFTDKIEDVLKTEEVHTISAKEMKKFKEIKTTEQYNIKHPVYHINTNILNFDNETTDRLLKSFLESTLHHANILSFSYKCPSATYVYNIIAKMIEQGCNDHKLQDYNKEAVEYNRHPDIFILEKDEKNIISVDSVREIIAKLTLKSISGFKFVIINNLDAMNINSMNAILKVLEEPSKNTFFFLIHNKTKTILPTIRSRCNVCTVSDNTKLHSEASQGTTFITLFKHLPQAIINEIETSNLSKDFNSFIETKEVKILANLLNKLYGLLNKSGVDKTVALLLMQELCNDVYKKLYNEYKDTKFIYELSTHFNQQFVKIVKHDTKVLFT